MRKEDSFRRVRAGVVVGAAVLGLVVAAGCGGKSNDCHNMPLATVLVGQTSFAGNKANAGAAVSASSLASPLGGFAIAGNTGYLVDSGNNRILGFSLPLPASGAAASFALGQADLTSNLLGTGAQGGSPFGLNRPTKVSVSSDGTKLVVTDTGNNRVLIWNTPPTSNVAPNVIIGQATIDDGAAGAPSQTSLNNPTGAMIGNKKLVIVDQGNNRVLIWNTVPTANNAAANVELGQDDSTGTGFTTNIAGTLSSTTTTQTIQFTQPSDVWTDGGSLFISDTGNNRVLYWSQIPSINNTTAVAVVGQPTGFSGRNSSASSQTLNAPTGITSDGLGNLFIADTANNRVLEFGSAVPLNTTKGITATGVFGQQDFTHNAFNDDDQNGQPGDQMGKTADTNATQNTLNAPTGVFVDPSSQLFYVADRGNNRVVAYPEFSAVDGTNTDLCNGYNRITP